jgi:hypothetical protein
MPIGGVHIRRISTIGFSENGYYALDLAQRRRIEFWRNMMDLNNLEKI